MKPAETGTGVPDPDVTALARTLFSQLQWEQCFGPIPPHAALRVFNLEDTALVVTVGGLGDEFLFGPDAPVPDRPPREVPFLLTLKAMRLLRSIRHIAAATIEAISPMAPAFPVRVEFESDAQHAVLGVHAQQVFTVRGGELR